MSEFECGHNNKCWVVGTINIFGNGRAGLGFRDDGVAAITAMITVHRAQPNLHHCQKSTSSRYYRLTRLHVRSIDRLDRFQGLMNDA